MAVDPRQELNDLRRLNELEMKARKSAPAPVEAPMNPTDDMGTMSRLAAGAGSGMTNVARHAGHLFATDEDIPAHKEFNARTGMYYDVPARKKTDPNSFHSKESIEEQKYLDAPLGDTTAGFVGQLIGEGAATAPLGGPIAEGASALRGSMAALKAAPRIARAVTSRPAQAALEGAINGGMMQDPGEEGGAAKGAGLSTVMNLLGRAGGRVLKGIVKKSDAAEDLIHIAEQQGEKMEIPLAHAASEGDTLSRLVKTMYQHGLPSIPGTEGRLKRQTEEALSKVRKMALSEATPDGTVLPAGSEDDVAQAIPLLKASFDKIYENTVGKYSYKVPVKLRDNVLAKVRSSIKDIDDVSAGKAADTVDQFMARFSNGQAFIKGSNILNVKNELSEAIKMSRGPEKQALIAAQEEVERMIKAKLGRQSPDLLDQYERVVEPYSNFAPVKRLAEKGAKANGGNFTPRQLARSARQGTANYELGQAANKVFSGNRGTNLPGKLLMSAAIGGGSLFNPMIGAGAFVGSQFAANKSTQRALMGDTKLQQITAEILRKNPKVAKMLGSGMRGAAVTEAVE